MEQRPLQGDVEGWRKNEERSQHNHPNHVGWNTVEIVEKDEKSSNHPPHPGDKTRSGDKIRPKISGVGVIKLSKVIPVF